MRLSLAAAFSFFTVSVAASEDVAELQREPFELIRTLRAVQDQIAHGSEQAHEFQKKYLSQLSGQFAAVPPDKWLNPKNAAAAVAFALSGGDTRALRQTLTQLGIREPEATLWRGALAYAQNRSAEAAELLLPLAARQLAPSIAGHIALVQGMLTARTDQSKAIKYLHEARLLAPGTLIEEAALRRLSFLLAASGHLEEFEQMATQYLRRYGKSLYSPAFMQQFVRTLVSSPAYSGKASRTEGLNARLDGLAPVIRRKIYLALAEEAILHGKVELTRVTARRAAELTAEYSAEAARAKVYEGAALIVTDQFDLGVSTLTAIDRSLLVQNEIELLDAALDLSKMLRRLPEPGGQIDLALSERGQKAMKVIAEVDEFLAR